MIKYENVSIKDIAYGGNGVGKLEDGRICFVPFTAIGDVIDVKVVKEKKNFVEAEIDTIKKKSPTRTEPKCPHFTDCGGCSYQHITYEQQLEVKRNQLESVIKRIGNINEIPPITIIPSEQQYEYRNKLRLSPYNKDNEINYGLYNYDNKNIIPIKNCPIAQKKINQKISVVKTTPWGKKNARQQKPKKATIRASSDQTVIYYEKISPNYPWLREKLLDKEFRVPLESFFQVNNNVAEKLLNLVSKTLDDLSGKVVIDTFCGTGFLSINTNKKVIGIDVDKLAILAAKHNAATFNIKGTYLKGDTCKFLKKKIRQFSPQDVTVILDPPRKGCDNELLETLLKEKPRHIIYVSCDCSTLSRDLKKLAAEYKISQISMLDMFPQTSHFETVTLLSSI